MTQLSSVTPESHNDDESESESGTSNLTTPAPSVAPVVVVDDDDDDDDDQSAFDRVFSWLDPLSDLTRIPLIYLVVILGLLALCVLYCVVYAVAACCCGARPAHRHDRSDLGVSRVCSEKLKGTSDGDALERSIVAKSGTGNSRDARDTRRERNANRGTARWVAASSSSRPRVKPARPSRARPSRLESSLSLSLSSPPS